MTPKKTRLEPKKIGDLFEQYFFDQAKGKGGYHITSYTFTKAKNHALLMKRPKSQKGHEYDFHCGIKECLPRTEVHVEVKAGLGNWVEITANEFNTAHKLGYGKGYLIVKYTYKRDEVDTPEKAKVEVIQEDRFKKAKPSKYRL